MQLELISHKPPQATRFAPLLFVHGAYSSAKLWAPYFLPFFAEVGYDAHALSLRGHGASEGRERLAHTRLRDYAEDVVQVCHELGEWPVLIGHSMGGLVVQKVLNDHPVPAAVLMASAPPHGLLPSMLGAAVFNPRVFQQMSFLQVLGPGAASIDGARRALFRPDTTDEEIRTLLPAAEPGGLRVMLDMMGFDLPPSSPRRDVPVLVLGGEEDACIAIAAVEQTARAFGTEAVLFKGMPHAMMLDREWRTVAEHILSWLDTILAPAPKPA
jgi:pimeloyl-ACP methyl ester carboxylesterase